MTPHCRLVALLPLLAVSSVVALQTPPPAPAAAQEPQTPRFRGGANLVRIDAYVTQDGAAVTDLAADDFEVLEDNVRQRVESFEVIRPRLSAPQSVVREPNTVTESREMARDPAARVFVLFLDTYHVQLEGSYRAQGPITRLLNTVIGQDDLVGVMTPNMSPRDLTLARRLTTIERFLKDNWFWGERNRSSPLDRREQELLACYEQAGISGTLALARLRMIKTLDALEGLVVHLETVREDRKFVILLSEGWPLGGMGEPLARPGSGRGQPPPPPGGLMGIEAPQRGLPGAVDDRRSSHAPCATDVAMLTTTDPRRQFETLLQRANRANVSFYPLDARGLVVFDSPIGPEPPPLPTADAAQLRARHNSLRDLALATDGYAIVDVGNIDRALTRLVQDAGAYYLLGYYSSNTKLDGKFRKLTVRVRRQGAQVRARPGYLAPTEAEMAAARDAMNAAAPAAAPIVPAEIERARARLAGGRGGVPMRLHAAASATQIWITAELDAATLKSAEWKSGGKARAVFQRVDDAATSLETDVQIEAGRGAFLVSPPSGSRLAPGRYVIRLHLSPRDGTIPSQVSTEVLVPAGDAVLSDTGLVFRRGPSTGLAYYPSADPRFRRTERIRLKIPRRSSGAALSARLLGRDGKPLSAAIDVREQTDPDLGEVIVADVTLAPLAQGEYLLDVSGEKNGRTDSATYAFIVIP